MLKLILTAFALCILISSALAQRDALASSNSGRVLLNQVDKLEYNINKELNDLLTHRQRSKRSDIDSRLMELQAKIDIMKAFQNLPAGHGKFDFDKIGKRYLDPIKYMKLAEQNNN